MRKTIQELIDELCIVHCKEFSLIEKVRNNTHTKEEAKKIDDLNNYRSQLKNAIGEYFGERGEIKV